MRHEEGGSVTVTHYKRDFSDEKEIKKMLRQHFEYQHRSKNYSVYVSKDKSMVVKKVF